MPKPIKRRELIRRLRILGWSGPEGGGSHPFMRKAGRRLIVPNPSWQRLGLDTAEACSGTRANQFGRVGSEWQVAPRPCLPLVNTAMSGCKSNIRELTTRSRPSFDLRAPSVAAGGYSSLPRFCSGS